MRKIYIIWFIYNYYFIFFKIKSKEFILINIILSYSLFWGVRYDVGKDYLTYEKMFENKLEYGEVGYKYLEKIVSALSKEFYIMTILVSLITISFISMYIYKSEYKYKALRHLGVLLLITELSFSFSNLMRQGLACSIVFFSKYYYERNNKIKFILCIFLATIFHKTAILFIVAFYLIDKIKIYYLNSILIVVIMYLSKFFLNFNKILLFIYNNTVFQKIYYTYGEKILHSQKESNGLNLGIVMLIFIFIIIESTQKKMLTFNSKLFWLGIIFKILSTQNYLFNRISFYFEIYLILYLLDFYQLKNINKKMKEKVFGLSCILLTILFFKTIYLTNTSEKIMYNTILKKYE